MVRSISKTRAAAQAAALTLLLPVVTFAATSMERVSLPVPRPAWLDAMRDTDAVSETQEAEAPVERAPVLVASLPSRMPLPVARPDWLDATEPSPTFVEDEKAPAPQPQMAARLARVPLPVPRPDWLDAASDAEPQVTRIAKSTDEDAREAAQPARSPLHAMIDDYARRHGVPLRLAHRIVMQESRYNPTLKAKAHFGLMQVSHATARSMGYAGDIPGLLDAKTNLTYAMPYLANAWIVSGGNEEKARRLYMSGYYPEAKRKGLLKELRRADSPPVSGEIEAADAR